MIQDTKPANLNELPEFVHAADEDMYLAICVAILDQQGLDRRFAYGNIMDEYHECWFENYEQWDIHFPDDNLAEPDFDLVPSRYMVEFATDDLAYYTTHDPEYHVDNDITKPPIVTHEKWGDEINCSRCELDREFAFEDQLIALGEAERIRLVREYLDTVVPENLRPYYVTPSENSVHYFYVHHDDTMIGSAQFNDDLNHISIPLVRESTESGLFLIAHPDYEIREGVLRRKDDK